MDNRGLLARHQAHADVVGVRPVGAPSGPAPTESERIAGLPTWLAADLADLDLTAQYKKPEGVQTLRPIQSLGLHWMRLTGGLVASMGVGAGKGLLTMLAPMTLRAERPLLLLPAKLVETFHREYRKFAAHWKVSRNLKIVTYQKLSSPNGAEILQKFNPDLIIGDEAQHLRHPTSTRTKRVLHYVEQFPLTKFVFLSGTITKRGLKDYVHLVELALGAGAPMPLEVNELLAWANCIDSDGLPDDDDWQTFSRFLPGEWREMGEDERRAVARAAYKKRFQETPGVVATSDASVDIALYFEPRPVVVPAVVDAARRDLDYSWRRPDGEELASPLEKFRVESQLSSGFYYVWDWPGGVVDEEWMAARAIWHKQVRQLLKHGNPEWDSPHRVALAVSKGRITNSDAKGAWDGWCAVKHRPQPPTKPVWLSGFLVDDAIAWAIERLEANEGGILWYEHDAFARALRARGLPVYGPGVEIPTNATVFAASVRAHGEGKQLHHWSRSYVLHSPPAGDVWEQLIGRQHRPLQEADEVVVEYLVHTRQARNAMRTAARDALYLEQTQGAQRLNLGTWIDDAWRAGEEPEPEAPDADA